MWKEFCSCGYKGFFWHKHRETCLRWGHWREDHIFLGAIFYE